MGDISTSEATSQQYHPLYNVGAAKTPYFTPAQPIPSGTAIKSSTPLPKVFQPLQLRSLTLPNRIIVSPMCQYSAINGHLTDWHLIHAGGIISRGPGLFIVEATSVSPEGMITPSDSGLWQDSQIAPLKRIVDFAHSQGQKIAIQLGHAGRKASTAVPWLSRKAGAPEAAGGWPDRVISVSDVPYDENTFVPRAMTLADIEEFKVHFVEATKRALKAGFDAIEIHAGHGYLLSATLSAATNRLPAPYSGSLENRYRLLVEIATLVRATIPNTMPLLVRVPGSDWVPPSMHGFDVSQAVPTALALADAGVDFIDVTSGGLLTEQKIDSKPGYQAPFAKAIKVALKEAGKEEICKVGMVGMITCGLQAEKLLDEGAADAVLVGKAFLRNPGLVWEWAGELGTSVRVSNQIGWAFGQRIDGGIKPETARG